MSDTHEVKFCVCAMIDLLGFSSHLEISANDLRTTVGKQAVRRLETLESAVECIESERARRPEYYPETIHIQRINDALLITMDMDDLLIPSVGQTSFTGLPPSEIKNHFSEEQLKSETDFAAAYAARLRGAIDPLRKLVGLVSRIHLYVNVAEGKNYFPGAKTVISSGFRRPFVSKVSQKEDQFSANFALANSFVAENDLHGPHLYLDNIIVQMLSSEEYSRNIARLSHFHFSETIYDCFRNDQDDFYLSAEAKIPEPIKVSLFRKQYVFRRLNASPLSYLQCLPNIFPYLSGEADPNLSNIYYRHIFHAIQYGVGRSSNGYPKAKPSFIFNGKNDIAEDIGVFKEFLDTGRSATKEESKERKFLAEHGLEGTSPDHPLRKALSALMEEEVEIEIIPMEIENFGDFIFSFSEDHLSGLLPLLSGNLELLDYSVPHSDSDA